MRVVTRRRAYEALENQETRGAQVPEHVSLRSWLLWLRHVDRAFRQRGTWRVSLREATRSVVAELRDGGATFEELSAVLEGGVTSHPACAQYDRMALGTGALHSQYLSRLIRGWAAGGNDGL